MSSIVKNIILAIILIAIILFGINYFKGNLSYLSNLNKGDKLVTIPSSKISSNKNSNNYTYSIWFYVSDWQYRLSHSKPLIRRKSNSGGDHLNPYIYFTSHTNDINIKIDTIDNKHTNICSIKNFPLQKWVNLIVSLNGRTLDVYLDGKLVRTCILPGVAKPVSDADIQITPDNGFSGWTSRLRFWSHPLNPQQAYNVYKEGPSSNDWASMFNKYKFKVSYLVDNVEEGSFSI